jgi:hypothetical protein
MPVALRLPGWFIDWQYSFPFPHDNIKNCHALYTRVNFLI